MSLISIALEMFHSDSPSILVNMAQPLNIPLMYLIFEVSHPVRFSLVNLLQLLNMLLISITFEESSLSPSIKDVRAEKPSNVFGELLFA